MGSGRAWNKKTRGRKKGLPSFGSCLQVLTKGVAKQGLANKSTPMVSSRCCPVLVQVGKAQGFVTSDIRGKECGKKGEMVSR